MCLWTQEEHRKREEEKVGGRGREHIAGKWRRGGHRGERKDRQTNDVLSGKV